MPQAASDERRDSATRASGCNGCSCTGVTSPTGNRVLLATGIGHIVGELRTLLRHGGASVTQLVPGLLEVCADDPAAVLAGVQRAMSSVETAEIRALVVADDDPDALLLAALTAPTLAQYGARSEHADLVPLLGDELNAFHSVYQPIVSLQAGSGDAVVGYEALLRATSPSGPVMPDQLFHAAARAGWLPVLDRIGRTTALRCAAEWLEDELLFVNFVPSAIYRPDVCLRTTEQAAVEAGLDLRHIVFEVTESEQIADIDHLARVFDYYRERGCQVALDDLGSGFSSLNKLVRLRPDVVKLDKELVQALPDAVSRAVIEAIVRMTHSYGGRVLAECVETRDQVEAARELGVDLAQGWFFGRPEARPAGLGDLAVA